ncbi:MAG: ABC transporter ATP-binding protein [Ruminococcus sp.]|nr:ABC transporter ATP-binding protein [Ruminococcus sp.]
MKNNTLKWLSSVIGRKKAGIAALTVVQTAAGAAGVFYALLMRNMVDSAVDHKSSRFWLFSGLLFVLLVFQLAMRACTRWLSELCKSGCENAFKKRLLGNILRKDLAHVSAVHSGEWLNRLTNDTTVTAGGCVDIIPGITEMSVKLVCALVLLFIIDLRFAAVILPGGILILLMTYGIRRSLKKLHKEIQEKDGKLRIFLQERISSLIMIRSFAAEKQTASRAEALMDDHKAARMRKNAFSNLFNTGFAAAMSGLYLAGAAYCGYGILKGFMTFGTLTAVTQLVSQLQTPVSTLSGYLPKIYSTTASAERLMEVEELPDDIPGEPFSGEKVRALYKGELSSFGMENVGFTYFPAADKPGELSKERMPQVLEGVSIKVKKGDYVALTGTSGCGKSTILKLLMGVYSPDSGKRYLELSDGSREPLTAQWHRLFAYVPQGNFLMNGTLRQAVAFADPDDAGNDERIQKALKIACAEDFVAELEKGADTLLGERGAGLSEGQTQRIAVARAVFSDSPVLILDEATSALDGDSERRLLENLRSMTDKTVLIVTHRPAALDICDRVLEITEKGVVEK